MVMILSLSNSHHSGSYQIHHCHKKVYKVQSNQVQVDLFFDIHGIIHNKLLSPDQTISSKFYCEVLKQLRDAIWQKCQKSGRTTICIHIIHLFIFHSLFNNSRLQKHSDSMYPLYLSSVTFFYSQMNYGKISIIWAWWGNPGHNTGRTACTQFENF